MLRTAASTLGYRFFSQQLVQKAGPSFPESVGLLRLLPFQDAGARFQSTATAQASAADQHDSRSVGGLPLKDEDVKLPETERVMLPNTDSSVAAHPGLKKDTIAQCYLMSHPIYTKEYVDSVKPMHKPIQGLPYRIGFNAVNLLRGTFDWATGYGHGKMTEMKWLQRIIFLETVAGVPGMVGGMLRHMRSLRTMKRDHGWIHTLLEESENERMHLLTFMQLREPGLLFRSTVLLTQGIFFNLFFVAYIISPKICHAFVGYLEEEAVKTYTHLLQEIDEGKLWKDKPAPKIAIDYWKLGDKATMRDLVLAVRADEACHMHVNHTLSDLKPTDPNPFVPGGKSQLPGDNTTA